MPSDPQIDTYDEAAWDAATTPTGAVDYTDVIQEIKLKIDLAALISQDCKLDSNNRGAHENKHKSVSGNCLSLYEKDKWACFHCADTAGYSPSQGDCFDWIANRDNLDPHDDFVEILRIAAEYASVTLPTSEQDELTRRTFECHTAAAKVFNANLTDEMYADFKGCWGIIRETIDRQQIGFVKIDGSEKEALRKLGFTWDEILSTGLFYPQGKKGSLFAGRYIFPYWVRGQVTYAVGRETPHTPDKRVQNKTTLEWTSEPPSKYVKLSTNTGKKWNKYINPYIENIIFGTDSLSTDKDYCIITEGITDAIMAHQSGFPCVSPVTIKFSHNDHKAIIKLVKRLKKVYVCMDNEESGAGEGGANTTAKLLIDHGIDALIVDLPRPEGVDKVDLADYLRDHTAADFEQLMVLAHPPPKYFDPVPGAFMNENNKFQPERFAHWLIHDSGVFFKSIREEVAIIYYKDGVYKYAWKHMIGEYVEKIMHGIATDRNVNEVIGHVHRSAGIDQSSLDGDPNVINLRNGLYDIDADTLIPHTPDYVSLHQSNVVYDASATCPVIDQFFVDVLQEKDIEFMYELFGYALYPKKWMDTAVLFEGTGRNGKSRMIELLEFFVGKDSTSMVTPSELSGDDKYASSDLIGKLLNMIDDLGNTPLRNLGNFKSIVSGAMIRAQRKFGQAFTFPSSVVCVFGCNDVPVTTDISDGFFRRMVTIPFLQKFDAGDPGTDTRLLEKLTTQEELSGLFNHATRSAKNVFLTEKFTGVGTIEDKRRAYMYASQPIAQFVDEECNTDDPEDYISKDILYHAYVVWERTRGKRPKPMKDMTIHLKEIGIVPSRPTGDDGERYQAYAGINLKS